MLSSAAAAPLVVTLVTSPERLARRAMETAAATTQNTGTRYCRSMARPDSTPEVIAAPSWSGRVTTGRTCAMAWNTK